MLPSNMPLVVVVSAVRGHVLALGLRGRGNFVSPLASALEIDRTLLLPEFVVDVDVIARRLLQTITGPNSCALLVRFLVLVEGNAFGERAILAYLSRGHLGDEVSLARALVTGQGARPEPG